MEKRELKLYGFTIIYSYNWTFKSMSLRFIKQDSKIIVFSNIEMSDSEIEKYVKKEVSLFRKAANKFNSLNQSSNNTPNTAIVQPNDTSAEKDPIRIIKDIQRHTASEWNANTRQKVIGRSGLIIEGDNKPSRVWISNREYQMTTTVQKNILGTVVGTLSHDVVDILDNDGVVTSKNTRMGRLLSENAVGHHTCKTPRGEISFDILSRAFFQSTNETVKGIRLNYDGKSRVFPDSQSALDSLEAEAKGQSGTISFRNRIIREQATLRLNPFLDKIQNEIKFSHVHDGTCLVIDGGPGTGKTTTLIQRLKLLINDYDLKDYRLNYESCSLTDPQISLVSDPKRNWLFFSPNNLMRMYLRNNMVYEGLSNVDRKTVVWSIYLPQIVSLYYYFIGDSDSPFNYERKASSPFAPNVGLEPVRSFSKYYYDNIYKIFKSAVNIDAERFDILRSRVEALVNVCRNINKIDSVNDVLRICSKLQEYSNLHVPELGWTVKQVQEEYDDLLKYLTNYYLVEFKSNPEVWSQLTEIVASWRKNNNPKYEDEPSTYYIEDTISSTLKQIILKIAANTFGESQTIDTHDKKFYEIVSIYITHKRLKELGEYIAYRSLIRRIVLPPEAILFNKLSSWYKYYRVEAFKKKDYSVFPEDTLNNIVLGSNNKSITFSELALLVGFANNISRDLFKSNRGRFEESNNIFITAYKCCCIPVIGIDEATDYSLLDYYAIASLRDYRVNSVTLCGDLMQCMRTDGITDWNILHDPLLFDSMEVKQLTVSYRQSPELMKLADSLYEITVGRPSPYTCNIEADNETPKPLWYDHKDINYRAAWIASRIIDIQKAYSALPSIAVFTKDAVSSKALETLLLANTSLQQAGIDVIDCTNKDNVLDQSNKVRIFEIDKVKGMEFDAVFFFDIDTVNVDTDSINRFLYVGLSRAAFFIAVTTSGSDSQVTETLKKCFDQEDNWNPTKSDRIIVGIDFGSFSTKVCVETEHANKVYHKLFAFKEEDAPYSLPTRVHVYSDWRLRYGSAPALEEPVRLTFSVNNIPNAYYSDAEPWNYILPRKWVAIWYMAFVLFSIREQYDSNFQIQLGIKADTKNLGDRKKKATSLILSALRLMDDVYGGDFDKYKKATVQELLVKTVDVEYSDTLKNDNSIRILPESYASINMLSHCIAFEKGIHLHVNIGYIKSQLTFFEVCNNIPYIYNTLELQSGSKRIENEKEVDVDPDSIRRSLQSKANHVYSCLKYLSENHRITFHSGNMDKKKLHKAVSFWGGGSLDSYWFSSGKYKDIIPYNGLNTEDTINLSEINLSDSLIIANQIQLYTVAIGLSFRAEGDNVPFNGFDLFTVPAKQPVPTPTSKSGKGKNVAYTGNKGIHNDLGYRKVLDLYPKPRIQKITPEGYEHGFSDF